MSLWLTDYKIASGGAWSGRRVLVLVGGEAAGHLDFLVHPDGRAVSVWGLEVYPEYRRRNLASVMMDAMYAAYPTAWVNHGGRLRAGALWWDGYSDPASERNVHNRPPSEWAEYFSSVEVAACKAQNAYMNRNLGVDGHREAEYRYGQRWEEEARQYAAFYREARVQGPDPAVDELFAGLRLALPPGMHRLVHNSALPTEDRAGILLNHVGHGNLPADQAWNTTERAGIRGSRPGQAALRLLARAGDACHVPCAAADGERTGPRGQSHMGDLRQLPRCSPSVVRHVLARGASAVGDPQRRLHTPAGRRDSARVPAGHDARVPSAV